MGAVFRNVFTCSTQFCFFLATHPGCNHARQVALSFANYVRVLGNRNGSFTDRPAACGDRARIFKAGPRGGFPANAGKIAEICDHAFLSSRPGSTEAGSSAGVTS